VDQKLNNHIQSLIQLTSLSKALQYKVERLQIDLVFAQQAERQAREMQTQLQRECNALKSELVQRKSELDPLKTELASQRDQPQQISTEFDSIKSELQQLREQLTAQEYENQELSTQLADQTEMVELLKSDLNERGDGVQALCAELEKEKVERERSQEGLAAQQEENQELRAALDKGMAELTKVKAAAETTETLRAQAEEYQQQLKASLDQAQVSIATLNAELEQRVQALDSLEQAKHDLSVKIESNEEKYEEVKQANQEQVARNSELQIMLKRVETELEQFKFHNVRLETELTEARKLTYAGQQAIIALKDKYDAHDQSYDQASSEPESLQYQFQVTSGRNKELQARNEYLETQLLNSINKTDALSGQFRALQEKLAHEQQEKQKLGDSIQRLRKDYDTLCDKRKKENERVSLRTKFFITVMVFMIAGLGIQYYRQEIRMQNQKTLNSFTGQFTKWWARITGSKATLITLTSFSANPSNRAIILQWNTESEIDNEGFNLSRAESLDGKYVKINSSLIHAKGSPTQGASYKFIDKDVKNRKTYWYKLEDVDVHRKSTMHGPVSATPRLVNRRDR
jgi:DNA repair exonuclease SbcCD ATPase subunit